MRSGKTIARHEHTHTHREYRAATDESVQVLREMEKEALENVLNRVVLKNNLVEASFLYFQKAGMVDAVFIRGLFSLNGIIMKFDRRIDASDWRQGLRQFATHHAKEQLLLLFYEYLSQEIAKLLIQQTPDIKGLFENN